MIKPGISTALVNITIKSMMTLPNLIMMTPPLEKSNDDKTRKKVFIIGDSILNIINSTGLSKPRKVEVSNYPEARSSGFVYKMMMF